MQSFTSNFYKLDLLNVENVVSWKGEFSPLKYCEPYKTVFMVNSLDHEKPAYKWEKLQEMVAFSI